MVLHPLFSLLGGHGSIQHPHQSHDAVLQIDSEKSDLLADFVDIGAGSLGFVGHGQVIDNQIPKVGTAVFLSEGFRSGIKFVKDVLFNPHTNGTFRHFQNTFVERTSGARKRRKAKCSNALRFSFRRTYTDRKRRKWRSYNTSQIVKRFFVDEPKVQSGVICKYLPFSFFFRLRFLIWLISNGEQFGDFLIHQDIFSCSMNRWTPSDDSFTGSSRGLDE